MCFGSFDAAQILAPPEMAGYFDAPGVEWIGLHQPNVTGSSLAALLIFPNHPIFIQFFSAIRSQKNVTFPHKQSLRRHVLSKDCGLRVFSFRGAIFASLTAVSAH
jgi:hypothetical protein